MTTWPVTEPLQGERVALTPLRASDAEELTPVLDDVRLHTFIGGAPESLPALRRRFRRWAAGSSPDGGEGWLTWVVRRRDDDRAVGYLQATLTSAEDGPPTAELAWVVAVAFQGNGFAGEAAALVASWLSGQGFSRVIAHIAADHEASAAVARRLGLRPTERVVDGEIRWQLDSGD